MHRLLLATIVLTLPLGCGESRPAGPNTKINNSSPEGQFDWVIQRLERVVLDSHPSPQSGLKVGNRKVSYELFPPDETRPNYTAQVTIVSTMKYVHDGLLGTADKEKQRQERQERRRIEKSMEERPEYEDPLAEKFMTQMEELADESSMKVVPEASVKSPEMTERNVYELAYRSGRWELTTEPETDHERLWFEYALGPQAPATKD